MSRVHFLNVNEGDCSVIEHNSGHISVIDVCNARKNSTDESFNLNWGNVVESVSGNFRQKEHPENPVRYLRENIKADCIFRYIQTHPDMDHMDGIKDLFESFEVVNFWDTANNKRMDDSKGFGQYRKEDWEFYQSIRRSTNNPLTLFLDSDSRGRYYNQEEDGICDGLSILAPSKKLVRSANNNGDYNDSSYVLLYRTGKWKIVFSGDSAKDTWDYILATHEKDVSNIDVLIAPHHGRTSGGNDDYLDILNPKLSLLGNAKSEYMDYDSWNNRDLFHITNNQAGNVILDIKNDVIRVSVSNESFAKARGNYEYDANVKAFCIGYL